MATILWIVHVIVSIALIGVVLMQPGQAGGMGTAFGGGGSQTLFGSQGSTGFLGKATGVLGTLFFLTSLSLAVLSTGGEKSLMQQPAPKQQEQVPQKQTPQKKAPEAPAPPTDSQPSGGGGAQVPQVPGQKPGGQGRGG
ncbi:MAG TPA: preprotein translocase subunit SecG [Gammaproteobacteria bacterium]|nr:preprotein translocase subunit SecG [Gammaproteobacteria bacterium]